MDATVFLQRLRQTKVWMVIVLVIFGGILVSIWPNNKPEDAKLNKRGIKVQGKTGVAQGRVALVIGNGTYQNVRKLKNPLNDAQDMKKALEDLGFHVIFELDATKQKMEQALMLLSEKSKNQKDAVVYYAGHGMQINEHNYLLPIDVSIQDDAQLQLSSIKVDNVLLAMDNVETKIVILDACRNNPFVIEAQKKAGRNVKLGLAKVEASGGTMIIFATGPGAIADENSQGRNGLFTQSLLKYIKEENVNIYDCMIKVTNEVEFNSQGQQTPWKHDSLKKQFYFNPAFIPVIDKFVEETANCKMQMQFKAFQKGKQTSYEVVAKNTGAQGKVSIVLSFPVGLKEKNRPSSIKWEDELFQPGETKKFLCPGFDAASPGDFDIQCQIYQGQELLSSTQQPLSIATDLFQEESTPAQPTTDDPLQLALLEEQRQAAEQQREAEEQVQKALEEAKKYKEECAKSNWYELPLEVWSECRFQQEGKWLAEGVWILDMSTPNWQKLTWQEQVKYATHYQTKYAAYHKILPRRVFTVAMRKQFSVVSVQFPMRLIPPGVYLVGSPNNESDRSGNETQTRIVISQPFYMGETEVTQEQWEVVMGTTPAYFKGSKLPVEQISWSDAIQFCANLEKKIGKSGFRLPTEYEWEYACRAGTTAPYNIGTSISSSTVNYNQSQTVPCASLSNANAWSLSDMHGNVWEWCLDEWGKSYSETVQNANSISLNQFQNVNSGRRVERGGSWIRGAQNCRSSCRYFLSGSYNYLGCRLLKSLD